jgi:hypothetical protein
MQDILGKFAYRVQEEVFVQQQVTEVLGILDSMFVISESN